MLIAMLAAPCAASSAAPDAPDERAEPAPRQKARTPGPYVFGREGDPRKVRRVIRIDASDAMRFFPSEVRVKRGETVRFELRNSGRERHSLVLGGIDDLKRLARAGRAHETFDASYAVSVAPGARARLTWQFTRPGEYHFGCLVPGHFEAGMMGTIVVR